MITFFKTAKSAGAFLLMLLSVFAVSSCNSKNSFVETAYELNMKMVYVPGGQFYMGGTEEQAKFAQDDEIVRQVTLDGFYIAQYEVTQSQWRKVMGTTLSDQRDLSDGDTEISGAGTDYAMYYVSWEDAKEFVKKLRDRTGKNYVLPTEAQWEFAARGGMKGIKAGNTLFAGSNDVEQVAYYAENSNFSAQNVAGKLPNVLGIYDMSGNVYEWCEDYYGEYERFFGENNEKVSLNPKGPKTGFDRVLRGGSYTDDADACRVSARYFDEPSAVTRFYGFRVALIPDNADNSAKDDDAPSDVYADSVDGDITYDQRFQKVLAVGGSIDFSIDFNDGKRHKVFWESEYPAIADVDESGEVTGYKPGATRIAAYDKNGNIIDMISIFVDEQDNIADDADFLTMILGQVATVANDVISQVLPKETTSVAETKPAESAENNVQSAPATTTFSGNLKHGYPSGTGTLTFKKSRRIDMHDEKNRVANAGDYIIGEWDRGHLIQGRWYDSSNNLKETIILGKAGNPELDAPLGTSSR